MPPLSRLFITTFGLGYFKPASGTWGSLPPVVVAAVFIWLGLFGTLWWYAMLAGFLVIFSLACVLAGDLAEAHFNCKDPGQVVADETAGMALTLLFVIPSAVATPGRAALTLTAAFVVWRIMDIIKPPPANGLQEMPGGWGILLDDLVAAVYAGVVVLGAELMTR